MSVPHQLEGLFLDVYGTIAAGDRAAVESVCAAVVEDTHIPLTPAQLAIAWGELFFAAIETTRRHNFKTLRQLEIDTLRATLRQFNKTIDAERHVDALVDYWRTAPLHADASSFLKNCPLPIAIVSNVDDDDLAALLEKHGVTTHLIMTSESARTYKPDPAIFFATLEETGWDPRRVAHIGDSLHSDIAGAHAAGITSVWINRHGRIHDVGSAEPDVAFPDLLGVLEWLETDPAAPA
jgi:2-haloacid dehalogenase/putative hydrolase of the HAD superfamily